MGFPTRASSPNPPPVGAKAKRAGIAVLVILGVVGWIYLQDRLARQKSWEGTLTGTDRTYQWWHGLPTHSPPWYHHTLYWLVRTTDGSNLRVKVPETPWREAKLGDPVRKRVGERWPELAAAAADRKRQVLDRAVDVPFSVPSPTP